MFKSKIKIVLDIIVVIVIFIGAFWLGKIAQQNIQIQIEVARFGYFGIFIVALVTGFNLAVPIPAISFLPAFVASGLNLYLAILIITAGETIADMVTYFIGAAGRGLFEKAAKSKITKRLDALRQSHPLLPIIGLFLWASLVPVPNEVLVGPLGFLKYRAYAIFLTVGSGNLVFNILYAQGVIKLFSVI